MARRRGTGSDSPRIGTITCNEPESPDLLALNTALGYSAKQSLTARGSEWVLLTRGHRAGAALVIGEGDVVALTMLARRYESLEIWLFDSYDQSLWTKAASLFDIHLRVRQLSVDEIFSRLASQPNVYDLVAVYDSLGRLTDGDVAQRNLLFDLIEKALSSDGQFCLVTAVDPRLATWIRPKRTAADRVSLRRLRRTLSTMPVLQIFYLYPDHWHPQEILGWATAVPSQHRNRLTKCLDMFGLVAPLHNSVAILGGSRKITSFLQRVVDEACDAADYKGETSIQLCLARDNGTVTAMLNTDLADSAVLRIPLSFAADLRLSHAWSGLRDMRKQLTWLKAITPDPLSTGTVEGVPYYLERACSGITADSFLEDKTNRLKLLNMMLEFLLKFGQVDDNRFHKCKDVIGHTIGSYFDPLHQYSETATEQLVDLYEYIQQKMKSRTLSPVRVHGDFNPTNILCNPKDGSITGVIDWDACQPVGLPMQDIAHFMMYRHRSERSMNIGRATIAAVSGSLFDDSELQILQRYREALNIDEDISACLFISYWIRHIALHIKYRNGPLPKKWLKANFSEPLRQLSHLTF